MTKPVAELRSITKTYPGVVALHEVDLDVRPGEVHGLAGENGAGKSTLIKVLSGAVEPDSGEIWLDGERVRLRSPRDAIERGISVVHQELAGAPHLSVTENILLGRLPTRFGRVDWSRAHRQAREALDRLSVHFSERALMGSLSLGRQQLVEIARALVRNARILVLDEPSAILGRHDLDVLFTTIRELRAAGVGCVYISHRLEEHFALADRVTVLKDGQRVGTYPIEELDEDRLVTLMTGRELTAPERPERPPGGQPVLQVAGLTRRGVFDDISFEVHAGEIIGLAGLVGSGRTEVARAIAGLDPVDAGAVHVRGHELKLGHPIAARRTGVGLLPENRKEQGLLLNRSVRENVGIASLAKRSRLGFIDGPGDLREVEALAERVGLRYTGPGQVVRNLSGGNQQKTLFARWLAADADVLLLDEPTRGVDVGGKSDIYQLMRALADRGAAIVMISSEVEEVVAMSDVVLVMREGRIVERLTGDEISEDAIMRAALVRSVGEDEPEEAVA